MIGLNDMSLDKVNLVGLNDVELASLNTMATVVGGACSAVDIKNIMLTLNGVTYAYENGGEYASSTKYRKIEFLVTKTELIAFIAHADIELEDVNGVIFKVNKISSYVDAQVYYVDDTSSSTITIGDDEYVINKKPTETEKPKMRKVVIGGDAYYGDDTEFVNLFLMQQSNSLSDDIEEYKYNFNGTTIELDPNESSDQGWRVYVNGWTSNFYDDIEFEDCIVAKLNDYGTFNYFEGGIALDHSEYERLQNGEAIPRFVNGKLRYLKYESDSCGGFVISCYDSLDSERPYTEFVNPTDTKGEHIDEQLDEDDE